MIFEILAVGALLKACTGKSSGRRNALHQEGDSFYDTKTRMNYNIQDNTSYRGKPPFTPSKNNRVAK